MKIYISGPMSKYPNQNYYAFNDAEVQLAAAGYEVINPARHPYDPEMVWSDYLKLDLQDLLQADAVATLPDWKESRGASLEVHVAHALGMSVLPLHMWLAAKHYNTNT